MSLVSREIPGLYNGVSQQPPSMRHDTQCELQENCLGTLTKGLIRRPATKFVAKMTGSKATSTSFFHTIDRSSDEQYTLIATGDDTEPLEVWNKDGTKATISYGAEAHILGFKTDRKSTTIATDGTTRTYASQPETSLAFSTYKAITIADHTIISAMNFPWYTHTFNVGEESNIVQFGRSDAGWSVPEMPVGVTHTYNGMGPTSSPTNVLLWLKQTQLYCKMKFIVNGNTFQHNVGSTIDDTSVVMEAVKAAIDGWSLPWVQTYQFGSILGIRLLSDAYIIDGTTYIPTLTVNTHDGWGETLIESIQGSAHKYTDLPPIAFHGYRVAITADERGKASGTYYVVFKRNGMSWMTVGGDYNIVSSGDSAPGTGTWYETKKYDLFYNADPEAEDGTYASYAFATPEGWTTSSMPHSLTRVGLNSFEFIPDLWRTRQVGDDENSPIPAFGGYYDVTPAPSNSISGLICFKNRLGILYGDSIILSRASDFFNMWPKTMLEVLDDDPIDIASGDPWAGYFRWAIPIEKHLILFSDQTQQVLGSGNDTLNPKSCSLDVATRFRCSAVTQPVASGTNIYFMSGSNSYGNLMEYFVQPDGITTDAADVTAHCPRYLPGMDGTLAACLPENMIFYLPNADRKTIYVYKYYWKGDEKLQSSWCKWTFDVDAILDVRVFGSSLQLIVSDGGQVLLQKMDLDESIINAIPYQPALDGFVQCTGQAVAEGTALSLGYTDDATNFVVLDSDGALVPTGVKHPSNSAYCLIPGVNRHGETFYCGKTFTSRFRFNEWFLTDGDGRVQLDVKLIYKFLELVYNDTGYFRAEVTPKGRPTFSKEFTPSSLQSGKFRTMVGSDALGTVVDIVSSSHLPMEIQSATRIGFMTKKARSI